MKSPSKALRNLRGKRGIALILARGAQTDAAKKDACTAAAGDK